MIIPRFFYLPCCLQRRIVARCQKAQHANRANYPTGHPNTPGVTALFALMGAIKQPFTTAWWCLFVLSALAFAGWVKGKRVCLLTLGERAWDPTLAYLRGLLLDRTSYGVVILAVDIKWVLNVISSIFLALYPLFHSSLHPLPHHWGFAHPFTINPWVLKHRSVA